jgi:hypothetical protein
LLQINSLTRRLCNGAAQKEGLVITGRGRNARKYQHSCPQSLLAIFYHFMILIGTSEGSDTQSHKLKVASIAVPNRVESNTNQNTGMTPHREQHTRTTSKAINNRRDVQIVLHSSLGTVHHLMSSSSDSGRHWSRKAYRLPAISNTYPQYQKTEECDHSANMG